MMQPLDQTENLEAETTDQVPESGDRVVPFLILVSIMMNVLPSFVSRRRGVAWAVLQRGLEQGRDRQLPLILHLRLRLRRRLHLRLRRRVHHEQVRVLRLQCFDLRLEVLEFGLMMRREGVLRVHEVRAHVLHREIPLDLRLVGLDGARRRPPCRLHHRRVGAPAGVLQPLVLGPVLGRELPCVPRRLQRVQRVLPQRKLLAHQPGDAGLDLVHKRVVLSLVPVGSERVWLQELVPVVEYNPLRR
mmetsp:Transcript_7568/g.17817  ORF Transcript_7568/g.17817 Transcript_7568/m.17817 type:complete len:245 (+) Transcript_7568:141-875(+)